MVRLLLAALLLGLVRAASAEALLGPFTSWTNFKATYHAAGDGRADDTAALQKALDELGTAGHAATLYLPAGTYRITRGLTMTSQVNVGVLGAGPDRTTIRWDGAAGGMMLRCNGVRFSRFGRLTWDGAGRAGTAVAHQWDGHTPGADTHNEHADEVFRDVGSGLRAGLPHFMDAECAVLRCRFVRCSQAGVRLESFNALDWFVRDCRFEKCRVGVTNDPGAGGFHVYGSLFLGSTEADIKIQNAEYFSVRGNTSLGSRMFYQAGWIGAGAGQTVQGNTILAAQSAPAIQIGNLGPLLLLDNTVDTTGAPAVQVNDAAPYLSAGNTFTMSHPIQGKGLIASLDDETVPQSVRLPKPPPWVAPTGPPPPVTEVSGGSTAAAIQRAITAAAKRRGKRPVVHLPPGDYAIDRTLVIPALCDVQIVGDGYATVLRWAGAGGGPVLRLTGPSRATLRDLTVDGAGAAAGIALSRCDQPGGRVFMEQGEVTACKQIGLLVDGAGQVNVQLQDFYHSGCGIGVQSVGSKVDLFGGASSNNQLSYDVQAGGQIVAEDIWYEGAPPRFVHLTGAGAFTLDGANVATGRPGPNEAATDPDFAAIEADDFRGSLTLLATRLGTKVSVHGAGGATDVLALGVQGDDAGYFVNTSPHARAVLLGSLRSTEGGGAAPVPDQGAAAPGFLRRMLAPIRRERPYPPAPLPGGVTDVRVYRVNVRNATVGFRLSPD